MVTTVPIIFDFQSTQARRGAQEVVRSFDQVRGAASRTQGTLVQQDRSVAQAGRGFRLLSRAILPLVGAFGALEAVNLADRFVDLQNRIRPLVDSTEDLNFAYEELDDVALRTLSTTDETIRLFARLTVATGDLGLSLEENIQLTETLNNLQRITTATSAEATNAIRQFSQGLAAGRFAGEELRSVLENLPALAQIIADELGVFRGELRELGQEGRLGPEILVSALVNAREEIQRLANEQVPTAARGIRVLADQLADTASRFVFIAAEGRSFGQILIDIAQSIDDLEQDIGPFAVRTGASFRLLAATADQFLEVTLAAGRILRNFAFDTETSQETLDEFAASFEENAESINEALATLFADDSVIRAAASRSGRAAGEAFGSGFSAGRDIDPSEGRRDRERELQRALEQEQTFRDLQRDLVEDELDVIRQQQEDRLLILRAAAEQNLVDEQEIADARVRINASAERQIREETERRANAQAAANARSTRALTSNISGAIGSFQQLFEVLGEENEEFAIAAKALSLAQAVINTAQAVTTTLASLPFPANIPAAALVAAAGAAQIATIVATTVQGRQEGGAIGGAGTGDSVPAMLEPGEFVVNRNATARFGPQLARLNKQVPRFQTGGAVGSETFSDRDTRGTTINFITDARGADLGTVAALEERLTRVEQTLVEMPEIIQSERSQNPGFFQSR